jgi:uncharacterized protein (TIGR00290 family)
MHKIPCVISWSGGKDCNLALDEIIREQQYDIRYLLTTFHLPASTVDMHGIHETLIQAQAEALNIPLKKIFIQEKDNASFESAWEKALLPLKKEGIQTIIFGDIFLDDLRAYRENLFNRLGFNCYFPLWKKDTSMLANYFIEKKFKAVVCSVDLSVLSVKPVGGAYDKLFLQELPNGMDPCGENGEFHTYCFDGPLFDHKIEIETGDIYIQEAHLTAAITKGAPPVKKGFALRKITLKNTSI